MPKGKYKVIYADPPWRYSFSGTRAVKHDDYPTMRTADICALPISKLANEDCALFIWAIWNRLPDALQVIEAWGFEYVSCGFTWVKLNKSGFGWFWGMGGWTRQNSEVCLIEKRGSPKRISASVHSVVATPVKRHSQKPSEVRSRIEQLMGDVPRIELFARTPAEGWDVWGNEVQRHQPCRLTYNF